jgi:hypothetical protein
MLAVSVFFGINHPWGYNYRISFNEIDWRGEMVTFGRFLFSVVVLVGLVGCNSDNPTSPPGSISASIIGQVLDKASGNAISSAYVKIIQEENAYGTTTDGSGHFSFKDIRAGTYELISEVNQSGTTLTDTVGFFSTDSTDWGLIYNEIFASISGTIRIEGETDHSFIVVQLLGTGNSALTDNGGRFRFDFILPGQYDLYATNEDADFIEYRQNNIVLNAGDIFLLDTTLSFMFRPLVLSPTPELYPTSSAKGSGGFAYFDGIFYYGGNQGLWAYNPETELDTLIYRHQFLGTPKIASDYNDGCWLASDTPEHWIWRKYSTTEGTVTDSLPNTQFAVDGFNLAWDPITSRLFGVGWSNQGPALNIYDPSTGSIGNVLLPLIYDESKYLDLRIAGIFIDPNGKLYLTIRYQNADGWQNHLYLCNNTVDFEFNSVYRIVTDFSTWSKICWFDDRVILVPAGGQAGVFYEINLD